MKKSLIAGIVCISLSFFLLTACGTGKEEEEKEPETATPTACEEEEMRADVSENVISGAGKYKPDVAAGEELMALVSSEEEAQEVAEQYGIELVTFAQGVATYHTEEDPGTVVRRGRENGWHALAVNHVNQMID